MKLTIRTVILISMLLLFGTLAGFERNHELELISGGDFRFTQTAPPMGPVRPIAEFEPAEAVIIRYPLGIPTALVVELANTVDVICLVSSSQQNAAASSFSNAGVDMDRVSFLTMSTDSYWTRDYAPIFIYDGNGEYGIVDFRYNRPRPNDNMVPEHFADYFDLPYYGMNLYQTGGNYMTDGLGTAVQSHIAYTENGNNPAQVDALMEQFLGITNYHVVQDPNDTYIDHVDCWGKFLAVDKILIRRVPASHPQYASIEATVDYFANQDCAWGYPYKVYRVDTPQNQPYTNSLILNQRVFVPVMNSSHDAAALQVYADAMPGYDIVPVSGSYYTPWQSTDALHCRTHEVPDPEMLHIAHMPYFGEVEDNLEYYLQADIIAHSSAGLIPDSLYVSYRINSEDWQTSSLEQLDRNGFMGVISSYSPGDTIRYYIAASDLSGRRRTHPEFAGLDPHIFVVSGDNQGPELIHSPIENITGEEVTFMVIAEDASEIVGITLTYQVDGADPHSVPMSYTGNGIYLYSLFPDFGAEDEIFAYRIQAEDSFGNLSILPDSEHWYLAEILPVSNMDESLIPAPELSIYPNPLRKNQELKLELSNTQGSRISVKIYNLRGQLIHEEQSHSLDGTISWDGRDKRGNISTNGIYFIRLESDGIVANRKLIIAH